MKSRKLKSFIKEIQFKNRNVQDKSVLALLDDISTNPYRILKLGEYLYRARIINNFDVIKRDKNFWGYSKKDSYVPPPHLTKDMRANYRYIPYLYCSDNPYVSVCEVRPRFNVKVSVATIIIKKEMEVFDLTLLHKPKGISSSKENLCEDLSDMFSKPITSDDDILDYIPTQYIAEYIKNLGYDGIMYKSSLYMEAPGIEENKSNIVIFNYDKCEPIKSNVFNIEQKLYDCIEVDYDKDGLEIRSPLNIFLDKLLNNKEISLDSDYNELGVRLYIDNSNK